MKALVFTSSRTTANCSGAMESGDHFKNGVSAKSLMNRKILLVLLASILSVSYANAQNSIGVQAGANFTTLSGWIKGLLETPDLDIKRKPGVQIGGFAQHPFGDSNFGVQGELLFSQLGTKMEAISTQGRYEVKETGTINLNCLLLRVHFQYNFAINDDFTLTLHSGLNLAYSIWGKTKYEKFRDGEKVDGDSETFFGDANKGADVGIGLGAALMYQEKYRLGVGYDAGIVFHNLMFSLTYMFGK